MLATEKANSPECLQSIADFSLCYEWGGGRAPVSLSLFTRHRARALRQAWARTQAARTMMRSTSGLPIRGVSSPSKIEKAKTSLLR